MPTINLLLILAGRLASLAPRSTGPRPCVPARARGRAESIFKMIFEFSAVFTCYSTYYKPIAKKVGLARPRARRGRAVRAKWFFYIYFTNIILYFNGLRLKTVVLRWLM